ncbi:HalOD1 output domain-containing protein [Halodesulfurarchaeum sp. HSR-GB]|uniref:HalOD1 output domain-containing protein n=1 Tax=Halodesulfurarchaeum sp. HSR-GB TaxID=3074077 RepID=UPI0028654204|nr:HalOD1 output domain-containing protein [Halodesulfurarchaeum sp. HSR-GB]MDR5657847.1 HalOD1 output domain-containing protein [Halodesulfurarchaeum sp. HSR-GB]
MSQNVIAKIVEEVADAEGVEPSELDLTLYNHIDTDALVRLVNAEKGSWRLSFDIPGYTVTVRSDGSTLVEPKQ